MEISKAQEGGMFTVVYRSQPIMKTLDPKFVKYVVVIDVFVTVSSMAHYMQSTIACYLITYVLLTFEPSLMK